MYRNTVWTLLRSLMFLAIIPSTLMMTHTVGEAAPGKKFKVKSYYVPVYERKSASTPQVGNLLQNQVVDMIEESGSWVRVNAFDGLTVGWAESKHLIPIGGQIKPKTTAIDRSVKVSPTYPGSAAVKASKRAKNPHKGPYRGVQYCVTCHNPGNQNTPDRGRSIVIWSNSVHANAMHTLFSPKAIEVAKKAGISKPFNAPECLKCHLTAYGAPSSEAKAIVKTEGVGCEACHGPGSSSHGSGSEWDVKSISNREAVCTKCHNSESPTWKGFELEAFSKYIAHWDHQGDVDDIRSFVFKNSGSAPTEETKPQPAAVAAAAPASKPRGEVVLHDGGYDPVYFPHKRHQTEYGLKCDQCHHVPGQFKCRSCHNDSSSVGRQKAFHDTNPDRSCRACHKKMRGSRTGANSPIVCTGCHVSGSVDAAAPAATPIAAPTPAPAPAPAPAPPVTTNTGSGDSGIIILHDNKAGPVHFPHKKHQTELGFKCEQCHHVPGQFKCRGCHNDTSTANREAIFHDASSDRSCRGCHRKLTKTHGILAPLVCNGCHRE